MSPQHIFTLLAVGGIGFFIGSFAAKRRARNKRRNTLLSASFPEEYVQFIKKYIPIYERLPEELKTQLQGFINVFLGEKKFVGCGGQEITDEVKVTIAAQACMLLLNRKTNFYPAVLPNRKAVLAKGDTYPCVNDVMFVLLIAAEGFM